MECSIKFNMNPKKIGALDVLAVSNIEAGLPTNSISAVFGLIASAADDKIAVAFVHPDLVVHAENANWVCGGVYNDQQLVASDVIDESKFDGKIW